MTDLQCVHNTLQSQAMAESNSFLFFPIYTLHAILHCAVAPAHIDVLALLGRCAHATRVGRIGSIAALGLGLIVPEDKETVGTGLKLGAQHRLIGGGVAPAAHTVVGRDAEIVEGTDGLVGLTGPARILQEVIREALAHTPRVGRVDHHQVGEQQEHETRDKEASLHSVSV